MLARPFLCSVLQSVKRLEIRLKLRAPEAWLVDKACQIIEVNTADDTNLVGDVAAIGGDFVFAVLPFVANA
jgi:hypothetical protein